MRTPSTSLIADYGRPSWSEVASVVRLAVRLRVGGVGMPPLSVAWGEAVRAVRLVALVVLLFNAVSATWGMGRMFWLANQIPGLPAPAQLPALPVDFFCPRATGRRCSQRSTPPSAPPTRQW